MIHVFCVLAFLCARACACVCVCDICSRFSVSALLAPGLCVWWGRDRCLKDSPYFLTIPHTHAHTPRHTGWHTLANKHWPEHEQQQAEQLKPSMKLCGTFSVLWLVSKFRPLVCKFSFCLEMPIIQYYLIDSILICLYMLNSLKCSCCTKKSR